MPCEDETIRLCDVFAAWHRLPGAPKSVIVVRRLAAHNRLRDAVYHWAGVAIQHDAISKSKYAALRARGHRHARALRSVADRLLQVACSMLENRTLFDPGLRRQARAA